MGWLVSTNGGKGADSSREVLPQQILMVEDAEVLKSVSSTEGAK
jgi:hypothetical protein